MLLFETDHSNRANRVRNIAVACVSCVLVAWPASAHVKWFAPYEIASQPRQLGRVLVPDFAALSALAAVLLVVGWLLDRTALGDAISRALDRVTLPVRVNEQLLMRATCGFFLVAIWTLGGTLLTPELKTSSAWVGQLQLAMAAALLMRRTACFTGAGIFVLYGAGIQQYGMFHLLDYPIFLGVALYLFACAFPSRLPGSVRPVDILRWGASVTLMWASVEKWAYPEWTLPIYLQHPDISMGYDFELFMEAAGVIEFTLAFALLGPSLVRRCAALMLMGTFVSATAEFGKIDVIGHAVIIAVLLCLAADSKRAAPQRIVWGRIVAPTLAYAVALVTSISLYYGMHALLYRQALS